MSITDKDCENFISDIIPDTMLHGVTQWIRDSLEPEDVFSADALGDWAENNGYSKDVKR